MTDEMRTDEFDGRPGLVKKRARTIIFQRLVFGIVAVYIFASMTILVLNALSSFKTRDTLLDCTQSTGQCAQENQRKTAGIIQQLINSGKAGDNATQRIVLLTVACSEEPNIKNEPDKFQRITLLENCVTAQLKTDQQEGN
jgi:hypothetical protein